MIKNIVCVFLFALSLFTLSSCGSYSTMQTARTVPQGNFELSTNVFYPIGVINTGIDAISDAENFSIPYIQLSAKYGILDKMDLGFHLSTFGQIGLEGKYQFLGDQESMFSMATGIGFNTFFFYYYDFQIPLHMSVHPVEKLGIYVTPKYIGQYVGNISAFSTYFDYGGFSVGLMYGDRIKVGGEFTAAFPLGGIYRVDVFPNLFNYGVGVKWLFGKDTKSTNSRRF